MNVRLAPLNNLIKEKCPACAVCGYDAEHLLSTGQDDHKLELLICDTCLERALQNVLLDSMSPVAG